MEIEKYAKNSVLTKKVLMLLKQQGVIENPLTQENIIGLGILEKVWWKKEYIRAQLVKFSYREKKSLLNTSHILTKWERYAFSRYYNLGSYEKLPMKLLISEIEITFGFELNYFHVKRLHKIRQQVYDRRRKRLEKAEINKKKQRFFGLEEEK